MGVVQSRVWKIENQRLLPTEDDILAWIPATWHTEEADALMVMLDEARSEQRLARRSAEGAAPPNSRTGYGYRGGIRPGGRVPGSRDPLNLLQTADYVRGLKSMSTGLPTWEIDDAGSTRQ